MLAGVAIIASALIDTRTGTRVAGSEHVVTAGPERPGDISANNSPSLAQDPGHPDRLAVVNRVDTPRFGCRLHTSSDGGRSWQRRSIPIPAGEQPKCFAPDAAFGPDGTLHVLYVTLKGVGNVPNGLWVASSSDGGRALSRPRRVAGRLAFQARIAVDPADPDRLYATWLQVREVGSLRFTGPGNPVVVSRSDDGGDSWTRPTPASAASRGRVLAPSIAVGRGGVVYALHLDVGEDRLDYEGGHDAFGGPPYPGRFSLVVARSQDRGATWAESVVDDGVVPIRRFIAFLPPAPSLAVNRRDGWLHVAFHDGRFGDPDVRVWSLAPASDRWRAARVNDTPRRDGTAQYLPRVSVAPDGRVDVLYYDRRDDPRNRRNAVSLQSSFDHGRTFTAATTLSTRAFDSRIGAGSERGLPDLGSRLGLVSEDERAIAVWTDTRYGTDASNKQDLVTASAFVDRPGAKAEVWRAVLRYGGILLLVAALVGLAVIVHRT